MSRSPVMAASASAPLVGSSVSDDTPFLVGRGMAAQYDRMRRLLTIGTLLALLVMSGGHVAAREAEAAPSTGAFTFAGRLAAARLNHTATLLADGRVLVVGGCCQEPEDQEVPLATAEVWDPATGTFATTGELTHERQYHTATLLSDGRVLVVGGYDFNSVAAAEVWDPATGAFTAAGELADARVGHTTTLLTDGRVLVIGGVDDLTGSAETIAESEVWDPVTNMFSPAAPLPEDRTGHTATLLADGRVLVIGGDGYGNAWASAVVWDPATESFRPAGLLAGRRSGHTATLLSDGRVLITDGLILEEVPWAEIWDPTTASFSGAPRFRTARDTHTITLLSDGRVLVVGGCCVRRGYRLAPAVIWNLTTGRSSPAGALAKGRYQHTATALPDGRVLIIGGADGNDVGLASAEVWAPSAHGGRRGDSRDTDTGNIPDDCVSTPAC